MRLYNEVNEGTTDTRIAAAAVDGPNFEKGVSVHHSTDSSVGQPSGHSRPKSAIM
jgi:hypothetical protein